MAGQHIGDLAPTDPSSGDEFGWDVSIDLDLVAVSAPGSNNGDGAVYIFDLNTGAQLLKILSPSPALDFGYFVAIHGGMVAASGAGLDAGAWIFDASTGAIILDLIALIGEPVSSIDMVGDMVVVGDCCDSSTGGMTGAVYVISIASNAIIRKLKPHDSLPGDAFGTDVVTDGRLIAASSVGLTNDWAGAVYAFDAGDGRELAKIEPCGLDRQDYFGRAIDVAAGSLMIGAFGDDDGGENSGAAYFVLLDTPQGTQYCAPANLNSTGASASLKARGVALAVCKTLKLTARSLPVNQAGYFLTSQAAGFVPFPGGSQGNLCLGGVVGRFAKDAQNSGGNGAISVDIELGALPPPLPPAVQPGETWHFQAWYRDKNPGPTSNFTDGLSITFY